MNITATLIGQMLVFAILVWFIRAVLWDPMIKMLDDRKKRIAEGLAAAERGRHEQELAEERAGDAMRAAKQQASEIIAQAQRRAGEIVDEAKTAARDEGERLKAAAQAEIAQGVNQAREQLRQEVSSVALDAAKKIIGKEVDPKVHRQVLDELIARI
ncbi:MAG: F0F1 ATP synthase subunit B [Thiotrichales bacterium]